MKKRTVPARIGMIAILLVLASISPLQNVSALEKSSTVAVALADDSPYFIGEMNGELYYKFQSQLWKTDGTSAGTVLLNMVSPLGPHITPGAGPLSAKHYPKGASTKGLFFFAADDGVHGYELWRSDGTTAGTNMVKDIYQGDTSSNPENIIVASDLVFFTISVDDCYSSPCELWRSDGTPDGTFFLASIQMPQYALALHSLPSAVANGSLIFAMYDNDTGTSSTIWSSDGTVAGTSVLVTKADFLVANDARFFFTTRNDHHLWATDGTSTGTFSLTDFPIEHNNFPFNCVNGMCYFFERIPYSLNGVWVTDGTPGGTLKLVDTQFNDYGGFVDVNGTIYFILDGQLWKTDNTPAGTLLIKDNLSPSQLISADGQLFFINSDSQLWKSDGTTAGTLLVMDNLSPQQLTSSYGQVFFINSDRQLWKSDGTNAGTVMVTSFDDSQKLSEIIVLNKKILLKVEEPPVIPANEYIGTQDWHLYKSDGTQAGTQLVKDFAQTYIQCPTPLCWAGILEPVNSIVIDGKWFFEALDNVTYTPKLWVVTDVFFQDVAPDHWAFSWVERLAKTGITGGCNQDSYCPEDPVTRAQIAVFLEKGMAFPSSFSPPNVIPTFTDTVGHWAEDWIEALKNDGITSGCATGLYCPEDPVTRAQMALFLLKAKHGASYSPPPATGVFDDVPVGYWADKWIEQLATEGITGGCATGLYCPNDPITRAQMAVFLVKTFGLP
jgi:ELWxxDGT repeat protein